MSKSLSQIYSDAIQTRNNYLQITELDSGLTNSKMSILNLITYVMSVLIHSYYTLLEIFEVNIANIIASRINGTPRWYVEMATKFQYNSETKNCDQLVFDEDTLKIKFNETDTSHQIIAKASYVDNEAGDGIILKICKNNSNTDEKANGVNYMKLDSDELTAFRYYLSQIKFLGANIQVLSIPGDIITIKNCTVVYNDKYTTAEQIFTNIKNALIEYTSTLDYNAFVYSQKIADTIMSLEYVENVNNIDIYINQYDISKNQYSGDTKFSGMQRAYSGYIKFIDSDGASTILSKYFTFSKMSEAK